MLIKNVNKNNFETSILRKQTFTGLLTHFLSFVPMIYKVALIKTLVNRIYFMCSNLKMFNDNLKELKEILDKNMFPPKLVDKTIKTYLDTKNNQQEIENLDMSSKNYFKLPYIGEHSDFVSKKVKTLSQQFCKNTEPQNQQNLITI